MILNSRAILRPLCDFLSRQIGKRGIDYLIPLESKGALVLDMAMDALPSERRRPEVLYLRSLEFLTPEVRASASFGVFDEIVFTGRTVGNAISSMTDLGIPRDHIHAMCFFKFARAGDKEDSRDDVLSTVAVPSEGILQGLPQDQILRDVQKLAVEHKIPASYDNLDWDQRIEETDYERLMRDLAKTGWFIYYGHRGNVDASALLVKTDSSESFLAMPKIRLWYDSSTNILRISPISFSKSGQSRCSRRCKELVAILTPKHPTKRQRIFAVYQAHAMAEQIALLGYLKPYFQRYRLSPELNTTHLKRYFGPRSDEVVSYIRDAYGKTPQLSIDSPVSPPVERMGFYWIAVEIMRLLSNAYWTQSPPRKEVRGFSVSELISMFTGRARPEAVHAAVDYCADMNFIATFFDWKRGVPFRAFRLTENGGQEVGRTDDGHRGNLPFMVKLGCMILSKSKDQQAYWWVLEKIPAILIRRFGFSLPQMEAVMGFYGDTMKLRTSEKAIFSLSWLELKEDMWVKQAVPAPKRGTPSIVFKLNSDRFEKRKTEIITDQDILRVLAAMEAVVELTKSQTMGHHVAILLDILSDMAGGTSYLANSITQALTLIEKRDATDVSSIRVNASRDIREWLRGLDEKAKLLADRREKLCQHMSVTTTRLVGQNRGDVAANLVSSAPFPLGNRIIPSFKELSSVVKTIDMAMRSQDAFKLGEIERQIVLRQAPTSSGNGYRERFSRISMAVNNWGQALSAAIQDDEVYEHARLDIVEGEVRRMYIVAYDLIGSSVPEHSGAEGARRDRAIQKVITNWFLAFGGYAQLQGFGVGDLGFGFFDSWKGAVQAALWADHHLELLKNTNPLLRQDKPHAGFSITRDELRSGFMKQVNSSRLSRSAKAWKGDAARIAEHAGRQNRPIVAYHDDMFSGIAEVPAEWLGDSDSLGDLPVKYIRATAMSSLPWR